MPRRGFSPDQTGFRARIRALGRNRKDDEVMKVNPLLPPPRGTAGRRRRTTTVLLSAALVATGIAVPMTAEASPPGLDEAGPRTDPALLEACVGENPVVCAFEDLAPGNYDVSVELGSEASTASTEVYAES